MRIILLVSFSSIFLSLQVVQTETKLQLRTTVDSLEDDDEDKRDEEDYSASYEEDKIDDDEKIYKNPRNSPSVICPRDEFRAELFGQNCLRKCSSDEDCKSKKKKCRCDGLCGMSCIKLERECPVLRDIDHGNMTVTGKLFGDTAHYTCDSEYILVGFPKRTCQADGYWSGTVPTCKKGSDPFCTKPPVIANAKDNFPLEQLTFDIDTVLQYSCDEGYETTGFHKAKCLLMDGKISWYGPDITCNPKGCGVPTDILNGWHAGGCYSYDCRVTYYCADGHELVGKKEKVCSALGNWMPKELPQCVQVTAVQCPLPDNPKNGKAIFTSYAYNAIVSYDCKYGFILVGHATRTCRANGEWSEYAPLCKEIDCGPLGTLYNGWIDGIERGTGLGASVIFRCKEHMKLQGNSSSVCEDNGKWRYPLPSCLAPCILPQIEKGHITVATQGQDLPKNISVVEHGDQLNVHCIKNHEFFTNGTPVICNNGTWSIIPTCTPARCKQMPKSPKNGMVIAPKMSHGMRAVFRCKDGFDLVGGGLHNLSINLECHYGHWVGDIPHCVEIYCGFPGYVQNGKVLLVGNMGVYDYRPYVKKVPNNKQIMYDCDKGYILTEGPPGATCIGGKWSPKELPLCLPGQHPRLRWSKRRRRSVTSPISPV